MNNCLGYYKIWDVTGAFVSIYDDEIIGAIGLDFTGILHVLTAAKPDYHRALSDVCYRVNEKNIFHVRIPSKNGSVFTSEANIYNRGEEGFEAALESYLRDAEFLGLFDKTRNIM